MRPHSKPNGKCTADELPQTLPEEKIKIIEGL